MSYDDVIQTITEIVNNEKIKKDNLTMIYVLNKLEHKKLHEDIFYKINPPNAEFIDLNEFEIMLNGILLVFKKNEI